MRSLLWFILFLLSISGASAHNWYFDTSLERMCRTCPASYCHYLLWTRQGSDRWGSGSAVTMRLGSQHLSPCYCP
ncbi:MAG: hypothetical protein J0H07_11240 [Sphingobacteriales bacterium]|nr:hypothetical protein [Sphingobacteriales bacterium]